MITFGEFQLETQLMVISLNTNPLQEMYFKMKRKKDHAEQSLKISTSDVTMGAREDGTRHIALSVRLESIEHYSYQPKQFPKTRILILRGSLLKRTAIK